MAVRILQRRFPNNGAAERRHILARGASPWERVAKTASPGRGGIGATLGSEYERSAGRRIRIPSLDASCMSPLRGFASIGSATRGLRPWLNYAAAPRLDLPQDR